MTTDQIVTLIVAVLASPLLVDGVKWLGRLIFRKSSLKKDLQVLSDSVNENLAELRKFSDESYTDRLRIKLMLLIKDYPDSGDIPELAKEYINRGGNSFILPLVERWYDETAGLAKPSWLIDALEKHTR